MNTELTAKQIARIERIRAERAAAKDNIHYHRECVGCGDTPCVKPADPLDPPYCEDCSKVCDEINVDDRDSPNIFPYKKCAFCHERSSCGNYTDDDQWQCESCAPDEEPMKVSNLSGPAADMLQDGLTMILAMKINEDYLECIKAIMGLMELFKGDAGFHKLLVDLRDETKNLWRKKIDKNKKRK
jgi:hypothetical protein